MQKHFSILVPFIFCLFLATVSLGMAQDLSQEEVLAKLEETAASLHDAKFLLTGKLIDADGTEFPLEVDVQIIPDMKLARADFYQPDALADNFILVDGDGLYNYIFLTNQATLLNANDPDALGGLLGGGGDPGDKPFELNLNLEEIFAGWDLSIKGYEESPAGNVYVLQFDNVEENVVIHKVEGRVIDGEWHPYSLMFYGETDNLMAELIFNDFQTDLNPDPEDLRYMPDDVEIIDER
ncbi:MAG: hypothetical protein KC422_16085 [Trueperaceae bacterium]|nr:hypothetical protein [Trueperaceae bacterium]